MMQDNKNHTDEQLFQALNGASIEIFIRQNEPILGNIVDSMLEYATEEQKPILQEYKTEWDSFQTDLLETINDFENKNIENQKLVKELRIEKEKTEDAMKLAEEAKHKAENDLVSLQKRKQLELFDKIGKVVLYMVVGIVAMVMITFTISIIIDKQSDTLNSTWMNTIGIVLSNSFSIMGTIMGVKHLNKRSEEV